MKHQVERGNVGIKYTRTIAFELMLNHTSTYGRDTHTSDRII